MERGIVNRISVAGDKRKLCSLAIEKAEERLTTLNTNPKCQDSRPLSCGFLFEEVTSSSVVIILIELSAASSAEIDISSGISRVETRRIQKNLSVFPRTQRRISIANLLPCTEYTFRIVSYTMGHSEAKCFTKSVEIIQKNHTSTVMMNHQKDNALTKGSSSGSKELTADGCTIVSPETREHDHMPSVSRELDLNVLSFSDLNEEVTPPFKSSRDEDNGCTLGQAVEADTAAASHEIEKDGLARSHGSGDSQTWTNGPTWEVPVVDSHTELCRKKKAANSNEEARDCELR